ncbi:variable large family protein, partial [Borreliella garinii]|uniref:variable large family protein n=1 Tax=Borreliella garinii TaxID=29519 RepID=UPI001AEFF8D4
GEISKQLSEMVKAAKGIAGAADGEDKIGDVGSADNKGAGGDQGSVNGIANGMKAIVEAAGGVEKVLKGVGAAGGGAGNNNDAGKLFAGSNGNDGAADADVGSSIEKAIDEISKQLSEMVKAAKGIAGAADGEDKIGDVGSAANKGAGGDQGS